MTKRRWMPRSVAIAVGSVLSCSGCDRGPVVESPPPVATGSKFEDDIRHLRWLLETKWSWRELRESEGVDLVALERTALDAVRQDASEVAFLSAIRRFVAGIHDGHASVSMEGVSLREARQWPFRLLEVREGFMIDGVDPESFRTKRFTRGDLVTSIDGVTIEDWIDREARDVFASTDASRRWWAVFRLGASTSSAQIQVVTIARGETNPRTVRAPCVPLESPVPHMSWEPNERIVRELDAETGYFRPGSFVATNGGAFKNAAPEARDEVLAQDYESLRDVFEQIESKSKLVLDLRQNPGGTDLIAQALARHLLEPGFVYYSLSSKRDGLWVNPFEQRPRVGYSRPSFGGKLAVLIDARTFSTADNLACCLRDSHPDVRFVGQQTGSGSGAPRTFELPSTKARVTFCTMRVYAPGGKPVEGYGVRPDVEVLRTRDEVLNDIDVGLDAALRSLR